MLSIADRPLRVAMALGLVLLVISTLVLHFGYDWSEHHSHLPILDSIYFTVETVATVGFGDFSFSNQPTWIEAFGIGLIVAGTTLVTTLFALLTNALVSRRLAQSLGHERDPGHARARRARRPGHRRDARARRAARARARGDRGRAHREQQLRRARRARRGVPVVLGDATRSQTLDSVNLSSAAAVAILTSDDLTNIETGLAVRDRLDERWSEVPVVLRVFDRQLGHRLEQSFGFRHVWSTSAIAAPWFVGAVLGLEVLFTFYVGNHPFLLARLRVSAGGGLDGQAMREMPANVRVVAIRRAADSLALEHPPRRDTRFAPDDDAYLVGPYAELLEVLRHDRETSGEVA